MLSRSTVQIKHWTNKGFTEEEAKEKVREQQLKRSFTLEKCIKKYGEEEGTKKYNERQEKWLNTLNNKSEEEKIRINKAKIQNSNGSVSKAEQELMKKLSDILVNKFQIIML